MPVAENNVTTGAVVIPFQPSIGNYRFGTTLNDIQYIFDVHWNARDNDGQGAWYFDILEIDETIILRNIKIVLGAYLGRQSSHRLFTEGAMLAYDTSNADKEAGFDDISTRVEVIYIPVLELIVRLAGPP